MKKSKFSLILLSVLSMITLFFPLNASAATANVSISVPSVVYVGESFDVGVSYSTSEKSVWKVTSSSSSGVSGISSGSFQPGFSVTSSGSSSVKASVSSAGSYSISVDVSGTFTYDSEEAVTGSKTVQFEARVREQQPNNPDPKPEPSKPAPKPSTPGNSGNSGNTGNSGNSGNSSNSSNSSNSGNATQKPVEKTPQQIEEEKKAEAEKVEAEKKAEEEKKKEEEKKTPLIENIDIISDSENMYGLALETLKTEVDKFSYEYTLPKNIDAFKLSFDKVSGDVVLDFKESHEFSDEQSSISVPVKATKGDITQDYTIVVKKNDAPVIKRTLNDKEVTVLDDDALISYMDKLGFKTETYDAEGKEGYYFKKGDVKLQLLMDDEFKGVWYLLDSNNNLDKEVIALEVKDDLFFVTEAPTELQKETLNGEKYSEKSHDFLPVYKDFHPSLTMSSKYKAWDTEDGQIVYGFTSDKEEGLYFKNNTTDEEVISMEKAYVGFDQVDGKVKNIAIGSSVALLGLIPTNIIYYVINKKKENELI